jgi:hypothetical protein
MIALRGLIAKPAHTATVQYTCTVVKKGEDDIFFLSQARSFPGFMVRPRVRGATFSKLYSGAFFHFQAGFKRRILFLGLDITFL